MNDSRPHKTAKPELIIFGGTFDPPHRGHLGCVTLALARFPEAKLWVLPAFQPAGAGGQHKLPHADFEQRLAMCELMFDQNLEPSLRKRVIISRLEEGLASPNLTVNTLRAIRRLPDWQTAQLCFLIGEDQWRSFPRWASPHEVLKLSSLLIVKRQINDVVSVPLRSQIEDGARLLTLDLTWYGPTSAYVGQLQSWIYYIEAAPREAASSHVREQLTHAHQVPETWLTSEVKAYIDQHAVYQQKTAKGNEP